MKIHVNQIPPDGTHIEGEDPPGILELDDPLVKPVSPVNWALDVGTSDGGMFATGRLEVDLEVECVSCGTKFRFPLVVDNFAAQIELKGPEMVDLTEHVREDILLALPPYPHCDWNGQNVCKGSAGRPEEPPAPDESQHTWDELNKLKFK